MEAGRCRIVSEAKKQDLPEYYPEYISDEFVSSLVKMSQFSLEPTIAVQLLNECKIAVASHHPRTEWFIARTMPVFICPERGMVSQRM